MASFSGTLFNESQFNQQRRLFKDLQQVNSTTYVDLLGVMVGLERIVGETADEFLERVLLAAKSTRSSEYVGVVNELNLQFGTKLYHCMEVSGAQPFEFQVTGSKVSVLYDNELYSTNLFTVQQDGYVIWKTIGQVADEINENLGVYCAVLQDGPAIHLARQSNVFSQVNEEITGSTVRLKKTYPIPGSEVFTGDVPLYEFLTNSVIKFASPVSSATISYRYRLCPYKVVGTPINVMSMCDPDFQIYAAGPNNRLTFQAREAVQAIAKADRSYWAR